MALETIVNNLRDGYAQLESGSLLHADQLMAEQVTDASLRNKSFYVADGPLYSLEGKKKTPTLWLTRGKHNLVLRHLNDAVDSSYDQLVNTGNFRPDAAEAKAAMAAEDTLQVDLTQLRLQGDDKEWRYLAVSTTNYASLNPEERKLAERFYGQGNDFVAAMNTFKEASISETRVYVLSQKYVQKEAKKGPVGRAAWRSYFYSGAFSDAVGRYVSDLGALRGVRRVEVRSAAPENGGVPSAPQEITPARCYEWLLANPKAARAALDDQKVAGLSQLVADYLAARAQ